MINDDVCSILMGKHSFVLLGMSQKANRKDDRFITTTLEIENAKQNANLNFLPNAYIVLKKE